MAGRLIDDDPGACLQACPGGARTGWPGRHRARGRRNYRIRDGALCGGAPRVSDGCQAQRHHEHLPLMADCERGLGRPARVLELAASSEAASLIGDPKIELQIVVAGARADLGEYDAALHALDSIVGAGPEMATRVAEAREQIVAVARSRRARAARNCRIPPPMSSTSLTMRSLSTTWRMTQMSESAIKGSAQPLQVAFDAALVDLDGVAYRGPYAIPTAPEALNGARSAGMRIVYVTNNASREPHEVADHLTSLGIPTDPAEILTAAQAVARLMAADLDPGATVLAVGGKGLRSALTEYGFAIVASANDEPDAVAQGFVPDISWREFAEASYAIQGGARFFASNLDMTLPNETGHRPWQWRACWRGHQRDGSAAHGGRKARADDVSPRGSLGRLSAPACHRRSTRHGPQRGQGRRNAGTARAHGSLLRAGRRIGSGGPTSLVYWRRLCGA